MNPDPKCAILASNGVNFRVEKAPTLEREDGFAAIGV